MSRCMYDFSYISACGNLAISCFSCSTFLIFFFFGGGLMSSSPAGRFFVDAKDVGIGPKSSSDDSSSDMLASKQKINVLRATSTLQRRGKHRGNRNRSQVQWQQTIITLSLRITTATKIIIMNLHYTS